MFMTDHVHDYITGVEYFIKLNSENVVSSGSNATLSMHIK